MRRGGKGAETGMRRCALGFTLIELLVVIAIIAILASILFPVFSRARAKARQAACINNQKQIVLAIKMYCEDFDEVIPLGEYDDTDPDEDPLFDPTPANQGDNKFQWYDLVFPYVRNSELYRDPEKRVLAPGYGMNEAAAAVPLGAFYDASIKVLTVGMWNPADPGNNVGLWRVYWNEGNIADGQVDIERHNDGAVYGFLDGHVKWYREAAVKETNPKNDLKNGVPVMWDPAAEPER